MSTRIGSRRPPRRGWKRVAAPAMGFVLTACAVSTSAADETGMQVRGLLDIVGRGNDDALYLNLTNVQDSNFDNLRARVFVEGGNERTRAFVQLLFSDVGYSNLRFQGGYVQHRLFEAREVYLEAGKTPVHDGTWAPRTYSNKNPLIGIPLAYYYKSTLPYRQMPASLDQLLAQRGRGQLGVAYLDSNGVRGAYWSSAPMLYDNCWDYGAYVLGAGSRFDWAFGVSVGAPGAPVAGPDNNSDLGLHAKLGFSPRPGLALHLSAARGAYLAEDVQRYLPEGKGLEDYMQTLWVGSLEWGWRHLTVNSEVFVNHFDTPLREQGLGSRSYYVETVYKFLPGWYGAVRWDVMRFEKVDGAAGRVTWDEDLERVEAGLGYRPTRELLLKVVGQLSDTGSGWDRDRILPAAQVSFVY